MSEQTAEDFIADRKAATAEVQKLQQGNMDKVRQLANMGRTVDPAVLANTKIDVFVESFLDEDAQLVYVRNLETRLRTMLDEALKQVRQETIVQGVTPSNVKASKLLRP